MAHHYGALILIMPRAAFEAAGGMDERFRGWGAEDVSFVHAVDTLYGRHRTLDASAHHLFHQTLGQGWQDKRRGSGGRDVCGQD
jgi:predicted glycosyltransferase involved in capsule biosynthesis